ncbi:MAG TPA: polar localization protein TipN [Phenylobacterium sp.]|nr:polar localization protein TipN [Phenylobacterium sp.]
MKIKKRHSPVDFEHLAEGDVAPMIVAFKRDAATDSELVAPEALMSGPRFESAFDLNDAPPLTPTPPSAELAAHHPAMPAMRRESGTLSGASAEAPSAWPIYLAALFVSVTWSCAPIAFAYGYRQAKSPFDFDPFVISVLGAMAIGPAALVWIAAYMIQQGRKLGAEARRAKQLNEEMLAPAIAAGVQATDVVQHVREEIARAGQAAEEARETLLALRQVLAEESEQLIQAAAHSARTAAGLTETLGRERTEMTGLAQTLDAQATSVADVISQQARMVAEASDLAETQLREAEASLAARAADLAAAAGEASDAARTAGEDLTRHIARLETAGLGVADQISVVERGLTEQRAGLVTVAHALRTDQEGFSAQAETHAAQLAEFITQARLSTVEMGDRAVKGGEAVRGLIVEAAEQFRELADAAKAERDEFGQSTLHALEAVSEAAAQERAKLEAQTRAAIEALNAAAEQTRAAAARHAETARDQVDQLSEAAFTAGQKANQVFETRLAEARDLIERSAEMVEQAGAATARKLDEGSAAARGALDELAAMLAEIEARAARLPAAARGQAEQVRQAMADSMDDLMDQARRTAEETQAIDAAFQDRVRRNYDMLSEAVRLMGSVAGAAGTFAPQAPPSPPRERSTPPRPRALRSERPARPPIEDVVDADDALELTEPAPSPEASATSDAPRKRLKLTPTASDEEFSQVFEQAGGRPPEAPPAKADTEEWTWKELLTSLDEDQAPADDLSLEELLAAEITDLGIDPAALLPRSRIDEIAAAIEADDADGAREVVRRLAPAATRRLSRRLYADEVLKRRTMSYLGRYQGLLADALERDDFMVAALLGSDAGRIYLLLEAAAGDLV